MRTDSQVLADALLETEQWDKAHAEIERIKALARDAHGNYLKLRQSIGQKAPHLLPQVHSLSQKADSRWELLNRTGTAIAYRRALAHVGLTVDDVEHKYFDWKPGKGRCIVRVLTKDGRSINLTHPVPISEARNAVLRLLEMRVADMVPAPALVPLRPPREWGAMEVHILPRIFERVPKTMPKASKGEIAARIKEIADHIGWFNAQPIPVMVLRDAEWQMPLPYGYRLLGKGDKAYSFTEGTNAQPLVDNPYLPEIQYSNWRVDYPEGRPKTLPPIPEKKKLSNVHQRLQREYPIESLDLYTRKGDIAAMKNSPPATLNESEASVLDYCRRIDAEDDHEEAVAMLDALVSRLDWDRATPAVEKAYQKLLLNIHIAPTKWEPAKDEPDSNSPVAAGSPAPPASF